MHLECKTSMLEFNLIPDELLLVSCSCQSYSTLKECSKMLDLCKTNRNNKTACKVKNLLNVNSV